MSSALKKQLSQGVRLFRRPTVDIDDLQPLARQFYQKRSFRPAWITSRGPTRDARELIEAIEAAPRHGLDAQNYGLDSIQAQMKDVEAGLFGPDADARRLATLDLRLTRTFLGLAAHLASGQVDPKKLPADWHLKPRTLDLVATLDQALERHGIRGTLDKLAPEVENYERLRDLLERYRAIAVNGGWKAVPAGAPLRRGQRGERVGALQARLAASGDLENAASTPVFDATTEAAVRRFQLRHGLEPDGAIGADDLGALNVSIERRIDQIELNMERWRWRGQPFGDRYVVVNIPDYSLQVIENRRPALSMRVIVGKQYTRTPLFSDEITYLVLNPYWNITHNIAASEMLPLVQQDKAYLEQHSIRVFDGPGEDAQEVDPRSVNWGSLSPEEFKYFLRQEPGPANPLGRVKFMCPNQFDVYLHDTSAEHLFGAQERDFSHGCIRVEKPLELAELLLYGRPGVNHEELLAGLATSRDSSVKLPQPIPVHLVYWTAWVDDQGEAHFRDDVYDLDRVLDRALGRAGHTARSESAQRRFRYAVSARS